jgi:hypothetical protein
VNDPSSTGLGIGPLTYRGVARHALGMFRQHYLRVALVALVLFVPPPLMAAFLEGWRDILDADPGLLPGMGYLIGLLTVTAIRLFGPVVFAGYLDAAVGHEYFGGRRVYLATILRTLPWGRLVVAEIILVAGTTIGLALFVLPGLAFLTLFSLIGPVLVQEGHGVRDGFERTYRLSRAAWPMVFVLVVVFLILEHAAHEIVHQLFHHSALWLQVVWSWAVAATIGGIVGLLEVALASELMARDPLERATKR